MVRRGGVEMPSACFNAISGRLSDIVMMRKNALDLDGGRLPCLPLLTPVRIDPILRQRRLPMLSGSVPQRTVMTETRSFVAFIGYA